MSPLKEPDSRVARGAVVILQELTEIRELEQKVGLTRNFAALGGFPPAWPTRFVIR